MVAAVYRDLVESVLPPDDSLEITYSNPKEVRKLATAPMKIYRFFSFQTVVYFSLFKKYIVIPVMHAYTLCVYSCEAYDCLFGFYTLFLGLL